MNNSSHREYIGSHGYSLFVNTITTQVSQIGCASLDSYTQKPTF